MKETKETMDKETEHEKKAPKKILSFLILKDGARYKTIRATSLEEAKGKARQAFAGMKGSYLEMKTPEGRLMPLFLGS